MLIPLTVPICNVILTITFTLFNGQKVNQTFYSDKQTVAQIEEAMKTQEFKDEMKSKGVTSTEISEKKEVKDFDCSKGPK